MKMNWGLLAVAIVFGLTACEDEFGIVGNGQVQTEARSARYFDEVKSSGSFEVYVMQGDEPAIQVTAESNLLPYIETDIDGDRLHIRTRGMHNLREKRPIEVYLVTPNVEELVLSGSGKIEVENFTADKYSVVLSGSGDVISSFDAQELDAYISGSGRLFLDGTADKADIGISGSGQISAFDLAIRDCDVVISGSGSARVNVEDELDVRISGSGNVHYINFPQVKSSISGSGQVINAN